jgi:hypothetical protein
MEEKYHALKQEGKSEHEAVGSVIANFGSIDEIASELGVEQSSFDPKHDLQLTGKEVEEYMSVVKTCGFWIGIGVWLILIGVGAFLLSIGFHEQPIDGGLSLNPFGFVALFAFIAVSVVIFIVYGIKFSNYEHYMRKNIMLDASTREALVAENKAYIPRFAVLISLGVGLIILVVGVFAFSFISSDAGENIINISYKTILSTELAVYLAILLFVVGFAVLLFTTAGMRYAAYDILLNKGEYSNKTRARNAKMEQIIGSVAAGFWPLVVAVYLVWSFAYDAWAISWLVWPVAGVLFGAFAGMIGAWMTLDKSND